MLVCLFSIQYYLLSYYLDALLNDNVRLNNNMKVVRITHKLIVGDQMQLHHIRLLAYRFQIMASWKFEIKQNIFRSYCKIYNLKARQVAASTIIPGMNNQGQSDRSLGQRNRFYSIGTFECIVGGGGEEEEDEEEEEERGGGGVHPHPHPHD